MESWLYQLHDSSFWGSSFFIWDQQRSPYFDSLKKEQI